MSETKPTIAPSTSHEYLNTLPDPNEMRKRTGSVVSTRSRKSIKAEDAVRP